jgi:hypothetical protein
VDLRILTLRSDVFRRTIATGAAPTGL